MTSPDSFALSGLEAEAISDPQSTLLKSSGSAVIPNEWNDLPKLVEDIVTESPEFTRISGLLPSSPGNALNAKVLKSEDSTKSSVKL